MSAEPFSALQAWLLIQLPRFEAFVVSFVIALSAGTMGFIDTILYAGSSDFATQYSIFTIVTWPLAYLAVVFLIMLRIQDFWRGLLAAPWLLAFPLVAAISTAWSLAPVTTAGSALRLAFTALIGIFIGVRYTPIILARIVCLVLGTAITVSVVVSLAGLDFAIMNNGLARGIFFHKNTMGNGAAVLIAAALALLVGERREMTPLICLAIGFVALPLAGSATAMVSVAAVLMGLAALLIRLPLHIALLLAGFAISLIGALVGGFLVVGANPVTLTLEILDRDPTLTGRSYLWDAALAQFVARPFLGTGYEAFWQAALDWRTLQVLDLLGEIGHFHNTYLEIGVELGGLGLGAIAITLSGYAIVAWRYLRDASSRSAIWVWLFLIAVVTPSITEMSVFNKHSLSAILFAALAVSMSIENQRNARPDVCHGAAGGGSP